MSITVQMGEISNFHQLEEEQTQPFIDQAVAAYANEGISLDPDRIQPNQVQRVFMVISRTLITHPMVSTELNSEILRTFSSQSFEFNGIHLSHQTFLVAMLIRGHKATFTKTADGKTSELCNFQAQFRPKRNSAPPPVRNSWGYTPSP